MEEENGYEDALMDVGEVFGVWNIEGPAWLEEQLPFKKAGLNCIVVPDVTPYKKRKVRILNGAHTSFVPYALLSGFTTVKECVDDKVMRSYIKDCLFEEIIPTLDLPREELEAYAENVLVRFSNPYIKHYLSAISLNSISKFCVRVLPSP